MLILSDALANACLTAWALYGLEPDSWRGMEGFTYMSLEDIMIPHPLCRRYTSWHVPYCTSAYSMEC
jgi:hypothetical protein